MQTFAGGRAGKGPHAGSESGLDAGGHNLLQRLRERGRQGVRAPSRGPMVSPGGAAQIKGIHRPRSEAWSGGAQHGSRERLSLSSSF